VKIEGSEGSAGRTVASHTTRSDAPAGSRLGGAGPTRRVPSADSDPPFRSVGFTISTIGYAVSRRFHEALEPLALEPREFALMRAVGASEGQSQQAIGERLQIPQVAWSRSSTRSKRVA
jgi:hypothetical protein